MSSNIPLHTKDREVVVTSSLLYMYLNGCAISFRTGMSFRIFPTDLSTEECIGNQIEFNMTSKGISKTN